ncbi:MAG: ribonuclease D [Syntrophaceae bacterium]
MPQSGFIWVDDSDGLQRVVREAGRARIIALDTEYDSFHYFREKLCLVQAKTPLGTYLLDPISADLAPLANILANKSILKIIHAGDNDLRILTRDYNFDFRNIFDTQRAASILGSHHLSLGSVITEYLGIELKKSKKMQRSQWDCRPLTGEQMEYAVEDIEYLIPLYQELKRLLKERDLEKQAEKAFEDEIASARWSEKVLDSRGHTRIDGFQDMRPSQRRRLAALYRWRFHKAKETNRAVFMILSDQNIAELAKERIYSAESLSRSGILTEKKFEQYGMEILEAVKSK